MAVLRKGNSIYDRCHVDGRFIWHATRQVLGNKAIGGGEGDQVHALAVFHGEQLLVGGGHRSATGLIVSQLPA